MKIVTQELSAALTSMAIENSEELNLKFGLFGAIRLYARLFQIQDNRDPIFIVIPNQAIVGVGSIGDHVWNKFFLRDFCSLNYRSVWHVTVLRHARPKAHLW